MTVGHLHATGLNVEVLWHPEGTPEIVPLWITPEGRPAAVTRSGHVWRIGEPTDRGWRVPFLRRSDLEPVEPVCSAGCGRIVEERGSVCLTCRIAGARA